ncbi:MAG: 50S ribosomal protein L11 methyltransferase [Actinomycetia bacterium]|nr:50S ribosomal protein L11 methyltransferase [Actinomycetes bacterium]
MDGYGVRPIDSFDFHHSMLTDELRISAFHDAIASAVQPGDIVVDIGSGTGILSMFAAQAGASQVYAIEREPIIHIAREISDRNGFAATITFLEGSSLDIDVPQRADVLISETIGNAGLDEGIVAWVSDAKERLLVPGAVIVPMSLDVTASLICVPAEYESIERWDLPLRDLDFSPLERVAQNNLHSVEMSRSDLVSEPVTLFTTDLNESQPTISGVGTSRVTKNATVHGIGVWFTATLGPGNSLSNVPPNIVPSWEQGFLPLDRPRQIEAGTSVDIEVACSPSGDKWTWRAGADAPTQTTHNGELEEHIG